jgi:ribosomal peptide maturation radical SAM protein 1
MAHRSKSAARALTELRGLTRRYPGLQVMMADNILDMRYFKDFIPALAAEPLGVTVFYEVKSNLKKRQVRLLRDAGVRTVQPGIESLSDDVLRRMRKGVTGLQNLQFLKWCKEFGIHTGWNILWGFPGEPPAEYQRMAQLVPFLIHLCPPQSCAQIRLDRFSPNFTQADALGFTHVEPYPSYQYVYPLPAEVRRNLAYFFTYDYQQPLAEGHAAAIEALEREVAVWNQYHAESDLFFLEQDEQLQVWDFRPLAPTPLTVLTGLDRLLYLACDAQQSVRGLAEQLTATLGRMVERAQVAEHLEGLVRQGLMVSVGEMSLSLAVQVGEYRPNAVVIHKLRKAVKALDVEPGAVLDELLGAGSRQHASAGV